MEALFLKLVNMSITASWLVLAVAAIRLIFRRTPKWALCLLWGLVALRLVCPLSLESALSLIPSGEPLPQEIIYTATPRIHSGVAVVDEAVNPVLEQSLTPAPGASANPTQVWSFVLAWFWAAGAAGMLLYALASYLRLKHRVRTAIPVEPGIKRSEFVESPFVLGLFRPVIYLPIHLEGQDRDYVIAHERAHIRRRDHWWKPLGFALLSVYWFNPVLWLAYILLCRDIEAACDEKVIRDLSREERQAYSKALLHCSIRRKSIAACPLAFGEVGVKDRIKSVMGYKKPGFWVMAAALLLCIVVAVGFLTDPEGMPLMGIQDARNYGDLLDNVTEMTLVQEGESRRVQNLDGAVSALGEIQVRTREASRSRAEDRDASNQVVLNDRLFINFSRDFSRVWIDNQVKPTYTYAVLQPARVKDLFERYGADSGEGETSALPEDISDVAVMYEKRFASLSREDAVQVLSLLETSLQGAPVPESEVPQSILEDTRNPNVWVSHSQGNNVYYTVSLDFQYVWEIQEEGRGEIYRLEQGTYLEELAAAATDGVKDRSTSGAPFATKEEPWNWTQNVTSDVIETARVFHVLKKHNTGNVYSTSNNSGILNAQVLEALLDILHQIPRDAFLLDENPDIRGGYMGLYSDLEEGGSSVTLLDPVNGLGVVIRSDSGGLSMAVCGELEKLKNDMGYKILEGEVTFWNLEDEPLRAFMEDLMTSASLVNYSVGGEYAWQEPVRFVQGGCSLLLQLIDGWEHEIVDYSPGAESFGVRCRPEGVSEGWLYFSFWPDGYQSQEDPDTRYYLAYTRDGVEVERSYPASVAGDGYLNTQGAVWSYDITRSEWGDYGIINEGADSWFGDYLGQIEDIAVLCQMEVENA